MEGEPAQRDRTLVMALEVPKDLLQCVLGEGGETIASIGRLLDVNVSIERRNGGGRDMRSGASVGSEVPMLPRGEGRRRSRDDGRHREPGSWNISAPQPPDSFVPFIDVGAEGQSSNSILI